MTVYRLEPGVQHYAWGDTAFIPHLLGIENVEHRPYAELWMGTHPDLPSRVEKDGTQVLLEEVSGGKLPYLMKILSARKPLSIQVHPSEAEAREGFARENAQGIPIDAPHRNYRDEHEKPELLCALTDVYALCGFRPDPFSADPSSVRKHYERCMTMPEEEVDRALESRILEIRELESRYGKGDREYWMLRCHEAFSHHGHYDRGLFSVDLLNLVHLDPGEAIYLGAGTLHAYLEGSGVEIMAASNNVLRGGLTEKHVDIPELLKVVRFETAEPSIIRGTALGDNEWAYETPAREFELRRIAGPHSSDANHGPEILFVTEGEGVIAPYHVRRGQAVFITDGEPYVVSGSASIFKATVPR